MLRCTYIDYLVVNIYTWKWEDGGRSTWKNIIQILFSFTSSQVSFKEHEHCCNAKIMILFVITIIMEFDICYLFIHCNLVYIWTWF
jgi:hypothetical protein